MRSQSRSRESSGQGLPGGDVLTRVQSEQERCGMVGSDMAAGGMVDSDGHV